MTNGTVPLPDVTTLELPAVMSASLTVEVAPFCKPLTTTVSVLVGVPPPQFDVHAGAVTFKVTKTVCGANWTLPEAGEKTTLPP